jgi:hypothetical protein
MARADRFKSYEALLEHYSKPQSEEALEEKVDDLDGPAATAGVAPGAGTAPSDSFIDQPISELEKALSDLSLALEAQAFDPQYGNTSGSGEGRGRGAGADTPDHGSLFTVATSQHKKPHLILAQRKHDRRLLAAAGANATEQARPAVNARANYLLMGVQAARAALRLYALNNGDNSRYMEQSIRQELANFTATIHHKLDAAAELDGEELSKHLKKVNALYADFCLQLSGSIKRTLGSDRSASSFNKDLIEIMRMMTWQHAAKETTHISVIEPATPGGRSTQPTDADTTGFAEPLLTAAAATREPAQRKHLVVRHMRPVFALTPSQKKLLVTAKNAGKKPKWLEKLSTIRQKLFLAAIPDEVEGDWSHFEKNVLPAQMRDLPLLANFVEVTTDTYEICEQADGEPTYQRVSSSRCTSHGVPVPYEMSDAADRRQHAKENIYQQLIHQLVTYLKHHPAIDGEDPNPDLTGVNRADLNNLAAAALQRFNREWSTNLTQLPMSMLSLLDDGGELTRGLPGEAGQSARTLEEERQAFRDIAAELELGAGSRVALAMHNVGIHRVAVITDAFDPASKEPLPSGAAVPSVYCARNAAASLHYYRKLLFSMGVSPAGSDPHLRGKQLQLKVLVQALEASFRPKYTSDPKLNQNLNLIRAAYIDLIQQLLETGSMHCKSAKDRVSAADNMAAAIHHFSLVHAGAMPLMGASDATQGDVAELLHYFEHFKLESLRAMVAHRNHLGAMGEKEGKRSLVSGMQEIIPAPMRRSIARACCEGAALAKNNKPKVRAKLNVVKRVGVGLLVLAPAAVAGSVVGLVAGGALGARSCYRAVRRKTGSRVLGGVVGFFGGVLGAIGGVVAGVFGGVIMAESKASGKIARHRHRPRLLLKHNYDATGDINKQLCTLVRSAGKGRLVSSEPVITGRAADAVLPMSGGSTTQRTAVTAARADAMTSKTSRRHPDRRPSFTGEAATRQHLLCSRHRSKRPDRSDTEKAAEVTLRTGLGAKH